MSTWFISRHPGAVAWAGQQGMQVDRCVPHLEVSQLRPGDVVAGTLPVHLAAQVCAQGASYWHLSLDVPALWRGQELSAEQLNACGARLERFVVLAASHSTDKGAHE